VKVVKERMKEEKREHFTTARLFEDYGVVVSR
jgi:hypothetical protein